jgi:hypothetical protein
MISRWFEWPQDQKRRYQTTQVNIHDRDIAANKGIPLTLSQKFRFAPYRRRYTRAHEA